VRFGIGEEFSKSRTPKEILTASGYAGGPTNFFSAPIERKESRFSRRENPFVSYRRIPTVASKKRIQALDPEDTALSAPTADNEFHPGNRVN